MRLQEATNEVVHSGLQQTSSFSIKASAKAFRILIDGQYSNKIGAVVREIATNAHDAHALNGNQKVPFNIQIPTPLNPTFGVRDYGPGLSHEAMMTLYTTVFESDKTDSNKLVGGFGLGSKAPFAVTDQFTVISRHENMKRTYSCYMDASGTPCISLLVAEPASEPSGLEVRIPVKAGDIERYKQECRQQLQFFTPEPLFSREIVFRRETPMLTGPGFELYKQSYANSGWRLVQGVVSYPIDRHQVMYGMPEGARALIEHGYGVLYAPIGSVEIASSREALSYTEGTKQYLQKRFKQLLGTFVQHLQKQLDEATDQWGAIQLSTKIADALPYQLRSLTESLRYNGEKVHQTFHLRAPVRSLDSNWHALKHKKLPTSKEGVQIRGDREPVIIVDDIAYRKVGRLVTWADDNLHTQAYLISEDAAANIPKGYPEDKILKLSDYEPTVLASTKQRQVYRSMREIIRHRCPSDFHGPSNVDYNTESLSENPVDGYYIVSFQNQTSGKIGEAVKAANLLPGRVFLVQKTAVSDIEALPGVEPFLPEFMRTISAYEKHHDVLDRFLRRNAYEDLPQEIRSVLDNIETDPASIRAVKPFWKLFKKVHEFRVEPLNTEELQVLDFYCRYFPKEYSDYATKNAEPYRKKVFEAWKAFLSAAPILSQVLMSLGGRETGEFNLEVIKKLS